MIARGPIIFLLMKMLLTELRKHHFFDEKGLEIYKEQLGKHEKVIIVTDPPFGGRPELITNTLELIKNDFGITQNKTHVSMN